MSDVSGDHDRDMGDFANSGAQPMQPSRPPQGHALVRPTTGVAERIIGAQHVAVTRDEDKIFTKLAIVAARAGTDWFYRYPVRNNRENRTDWIEGPSIKLANDIARIFGNCAVEVRELDVGDAWVFYSRFTDIETGFSMERAYRQRKSQTSIKTKDYDRQQDIAYQIGQSKAIRNVVVNSLQIYSDFAFEEARNSLVDKIGKDIGAWRARTVEGLLKMPVELARAERIVGRPSKDWLATDIAQIIAVMKAVHDGMATVDESFPAIEQQKPATADAGAAHGGSGDDGGRAQAGTAAGTASAASAEPTAADTIEAAYARGQQAKQAGHSPKAVPGAYRDVTRLALAWRAGHDGSPMPSFTGEQK
jgi:hypothetical protein